MRQRVDLPIGERVISRAVGILVALYTGVPRHPSGVKGAALQPAAVAAWRAGRGGVTGTGRTSTNGRLQGGAAMQEATFAAPDGLAQRAPVLVSACLPPPAGAGRLSLPAGGASAGDPPVAALPLMGSAAEVATTVGCLQQLRGVARRLNPRFRLVDVAPPPGVPVTPCYVRTTARSAFHTVGGPAMGRVLTPTLGVRGVPRPAGGGRVGHTDARLDGGAHGQRVYAGGARGGADDCQGQGGVVYLLGGAFGAPLVCLGRVQHRACVVLPTNALGHKPTSYKKKKSLRRSFLDDCQTRRRTMSMACRPPLQCSRSTHGASCR